MNILKNDGLFQEARKSPKLPSIFKAFGLGLWYLILGELLGELLLHNIKHIIKPMNNFSPAFNLFLDLICGFIFSMLLVFNRVRSKEKRSLSSFGFQKEGCIKRYFIGFFIGFLTMGAVALILFITGHAIINKNPTQPLGIHALKAILIVLPGWMIQSATEEVVTRGWLMNVIGAKYTPFCGLIASSVFFAMLHLLNPNVGFISIMDLIFTGVFYGLYTIKTKSLWGVCGMHAAWNFFQGNVFGFDVSGLDVQIGSIIDLDTTGSNVISGGAFGPEAGMISVMINFIAIIILIYLIKKQNIEYQKSSI